MSNAGILVARAATVCVALSLASAALAEPLSIDRAQELSKLTGRPILAVAGTKT